MGADSESDSQGLDDIRGAQAYFRALQKEYDPYPLTRECLMRFSCVGEHARRRIEADTLLREASPATRSRFLEIMSSLSSAATGSSAQTSNSDESCWSREAFEDALSDHVQILIRDRAEFKRTIDDEITRMSPPDANRLLRVIREIVSGLAMSGIEQGECMRAARIEAQELVEDANGDKNAIGWLFLGWLGMWSSMAASEACTFFERGLSLSTNKTGFLTYLLHRYYAIGLDTVGHPIEALTHARAALAIRSSPDMLFEVARYAAQANQKQDARRYLEASIQQEPLTVFIAMADSEMAQFEDQVFSAYAQAEAQLRTSAFKAIDEWQVVVDKAHVAERTLGVQLELPGEISKGFADLRSHASKGNLLEVLGVRSVARRNAFDLYNIALRRIGSIVDKRKSDVETVDEIVESTIKKRDTVTERSEKQASILINQMEVDLHRSLSNDDRSTQGCATGLGGSFAMFITYVVVAGFLTQRGVDTGWDSPVGMAGLCLIAAPIAIGLGANVSSGIKRSTIGSEVRRRASYAREMAKITLVEVEKTVAQQAVALRAEAADLQAQTNKAIEAQRLLREAHLSHFEDATNQAASRRAA